jgi:heme exporter protein B
MIQLFLRDVGLSVRSGGGFGLALIFFLIVVTLIPFALGPDQAALAVIAPGVLWLGALLACLLSLDRIFGLDYEDGTLDLLATSPLPPEAVYIAKAAAHWLTTGLPLSLAAPVLGVLLNLDFETGKILCLSLLLGHSGTEPDWCLWRESDPRRQTRRAVALAFGSAALCAQSDFWRAGGAIGGAGVGL